MHCLRCNRFAHLSLGKYSVLREVEWVRAAATRAPLLRFLYLGFYIAQCPKMAYKVLFMIMRKVPS